MPSPPSSIFRVSNHDRRPWLSLVLVVAGLGGLFLLVVGQGPDLHGPLHRVGIMDPLCGGTRATYVLVRGDVAGAWSWNPLVPLLALVGLALLARLVVGLVAQRWVDVELPRRVWLSIVLVALVAVEVNQQIQAERLVDVVRPERW